MQKFDEREDSDTDEEQLTNFMTKENTMISNSDIGFLHKLLL